MNRGAETTTLCRARVSAALRATRAAGEATAKEQHPVQSDAGGGMCRPASVPRDGHGGQHRTSARADTDGKGEAGEEDEGENEDNVDDDSDVSALDQTWSASTNGLEASSDEDSEGGLPAVHSSGYAALTAEGVEDGRRANFNRHKGTSGAAVRRAAAGACRQTRSALRKCGQVDGQVEFVGWGGLDDGVGVWKGWEQEPGAAEECVGRAAQCEQPHFALRSPGRLSRAFWLFDPDLQT